jgi:hypothetical protein
MSFEVTFQGAAEVLEVNAKSQWIKMSFTVYTFTKSEGDVTTGLLKSGSVILVDGSREDPISLKDRILDKSAIEAFKVLFSAHRADEPTDDDIFGTKGTVAIGESWEVNRAVASSSLKSVGMILPAEHLDGRISLISKEKVGDVDCLSRVMKKGS